MFAKAIFAVLLILTPYDRVRAHPGWEETQEQMSARLMSIAEDFAAVARNRVEAAMLLGIGSHESAFAADVDAGNCYRVGGFSRRCDSGRAVSVFQLQDGDRREAGPASHGSQSCRARDPPQSHRELERVPHQHA